MKTLSSILLALFSALFLSACGGSKEVRITQGSETIGTMPSGTVYATTDASIVHVNLRGRIATMRNGNKFPVGAFLIARDSTGKQTGILKARPKRTLGLRTADLLEGEPKISNILTIASTSESSRLAKIYRDPEQE